MNIFKEHQYQDRGKEGQVWNFILVGACKAAFPEWTAQCSFHKNYKNGYRCEHF